MVKKRFLVFFFLLVGITTFGYGFDKSVAQASQPVQTQASEQKRSILQSTQKSARLRRQEANKRLKEEIKAREAFRLAAHQKGSPELSRKEVQNE